MKRKEPEIATSSELATADKFTCGRGLSRSGAIL